MDTAFWEKDIETIDRGALETLQLERLKRTLQIAARAPYYRSILTPEKIASIRSLRDLPSLPMVDKKDLRENFPYGFLACDPKDSVRMHSSSGTTGTPTVVFHSQNDLDHWTNLTARSMYMAGMRKSDVFQNMMGYGLFTGGLGFHYGAERLGALVLPTSAGNSKRQIWFMQTFGTTFVHIVPSYALRLFSVFQEMRVDPHDLALKSFFIGAEPHSEALRLQVQDLYGVRAYNSYGLSEMAGPGIAFECGEQNGMHLWEDEYIMEIIDPATGEVLPDGECGELVLTTLCRDAMPLIRYRTHDLSRIIPEPCPCGRTHRRVERMRGRSDDMLIIGGVNVFPLQIECAMMTVPDIGNNYVIEIRNEDYLDRIYIKVEVNPRCFTGSLEGMDDMKNRIVNAVRTELGITPKVVLMEPNSLPASEGKAKRVVDLRRNDYKS